MLMLLTAFFMSHFDAGWFWWLWFAFAIFIELQ
jgi:hypothetical protein